MKMCHEMGQGSVPAGPGRRDVCAGSMEALPLSSAPRR